jgi:hypothetical protein
MANSKLHDDLVNEVEPLESPEASVAGLMHAIADRIEGCHGNVVKLSDLATVLRENPEAVGKAVLANTPAANAKVRTTGYDAPSTAFDKPREGVRQGMIGSSNDHRDQQFPENSNTEAERERIMREETARARGQNVVINTDMPDVPKADREAEEKAKADTEAKQRGEKVPA